MLSQDVVKVMYTFISKLTEHVMLKCQLVHKSFHIFSVLHEDTSVFYIVLHAHFKTASSECIIKCNKSSSQFQ